ncbi:MAG: HD domain-containing protein [Alkalispirochaeta sp.]
MIEHDILIGHSREDGAIQPLEDHLRGVARIAEEFGRRFSAAGWAAAAGILHDDGKALPDRRKLAITLRSDEVHSVYDIGPIRGMR